MGLDLENKHLLRFPAQAVLPRNKGGSAIGIRVIEGRSHLTPDLDQILVTPIGHEQRATALSLQ